MWGQAVVTLSVATVIALLVALPEALWIPLVIALVIALVRALAMVLSIVLAIVLAIALAIVLAAVIAALLLRAVGPGGTAGLRIAVEIGVLLPVIAGTTRLGAGPLLWICGPPTARAGLVFRALTPVMRARLCPWLRPLL